MARVSSTVTKRTRNPRPRKYASASERQAAYRARAPEVCFRAEAKTVETLDRIADTLDQSRADVLLSMTKFALANHDWARFGLTHKPLPFEYGVNPVKPKLKAYEGSYAVVSIATGQAVAELPKDSKLLLRQPHTLPLGLQGKPHENHPSQAQTHPRPTCCA